MIQILTGNDRKQKNTHLASLVKNRESVRSTSGGVTRESLLECATSSNLFGESPIYIFEGVLTEGAVSLTTKDLTVLEKSNTDFIFLEDSWKATDEKKYKKYASIQSFLLPKMKEQPKVNVFAITDAYGKRDKIGAWVLYRDAIEKGSEPEAISGLLFWKIKSLFTSPQKIFTTTELQKNSSAIVSLYHRAHRGEVDFTIGLEQFILSSLSQ